MLETDPVAYCSSAQISKRINIEESKSTCYRPIQCFVKTFTERGRVPGSAQEEPLSGLYSIAIYVGDVIRSPWKVHTRV